VNTRRKNRKDEIHRPKNWTPAQLGGESNVEAGWSVGWLPRTVQRDLQTLKGNKPHESGSEIGLTRVSLTGKETYAGSTVSER